MDEVERDRRMGRIRSDAINETFTLDDASALREGARHRAESVLVLYRLMTANPNAVKQQSLLEYRCRRGGCLLVHVFQTPDGPACYMPPFTYSPDRNADTHPEARDRLTSDSQRRRWAESGDLLDRNSPAGLGVELWLNCHHLLDHPLPSEQIVDDMRAAPRGAVIILPHAVR